MKLVSIIMPTYNAEETISEALESILCQSYDNFELIILDDNSSDDTVNIIEQYQDKRIFLNISECNMRQAYQMNVGIAKSKGEYIAIMHADDIAHKDKIKMQVDFLNKNLEIGICGTWGRDFNSAENINNGKPWRLPIKPGKCKAQLLFNPCFVHSSVMFRKDIVTFNKLKYKESLSVAEDYNLWLDFAKVTKLSNIPFELLFYRKHKNQISFIEKDLDFHVSNKIRERAVKLFLNSKSKLIYSFLFTNETDFSINLLKQIFQLIINNKNSKILENRILIKIALQRLYISIRYSLKKILRCY